MFELIKYGSSIEIKYWDADDINDDDYIISFSVVTDIYASKINIQ